MDKRTRVKNAMDKLPVDHVPVSFWYHFKGEDRRGEACAQAHLKYYKETDVDFVKIMSDDYFEYPLPTIEKPTDWRKIKPLGKDHPFIQDQVWRAKRVVELLDGECCTFYNLFAPFSFMRYGAGDELVFRHLEEDELSVMHGLDVIAQDSALIAELVIKEAGCDGVYYCVQSGEINRMTEDKYRRAVAPSDRFVLDWANRYSDYNIMHCCGYFGIKDRMELWQEYPSKAVNWAVHVEEMPLNEGREFFGGRCCLGGFETLHDHDDVFKGLIYSGTKEDIQKETIDIILAFGKRGLMLGGDCLLGPNTETERIKWVIEAARSI